MDVANAHPFPYESSFPSYEYDDQYHSGYATREDNKICDEGFIVVIASHKAGINFLINHLQHKKKVNTTVVRVFHGMQPARLPLAVLTRNTRMWKKEN